jgi:tetratricopeptide (TPR) repeat protein
MEVKNMSNNEIESEKKGTLGMGQLIELEKERSAAWIEILNVIKAEHEKSREFNERINKLTEDISKIKNVITVFESMSEEDKIKELRAGIPTDLSKLEKDEIEKLKIISEIAKLFPKLDEIGIGIPSNKVDILKGKAAEEFAKDIDRVETSEIKNKIKKIDIESLGEYNKRIDELEKRVHEVREKTRFSLEQEQILLKIAEESKIRVLHNQGIKLLKNGRIQDAYDFFDNIIKINDKIRGAWLNKGIILGESGKCEEEINCYDEAIKIDENYAKAWYNKGIALKYLDKTEQAEECFKKAHDRDPNNY